jgi:wyosine [tRNA(Phe)-imidazoG37] synthetase (radical SAM superfamily)
VTRLSTKLHDRDNAGLTYVYPVVSRRAGGVSVGVNLNPNKACNWRCIYCQVDGLVKGAAPEIDLALLESELAGMLDALVDGDYMERHVPEGARRINDVAISGDGEATSCEQLPEVVDAIGAALRARDLLPAVKVVLITNGSLARREHTRRALAAMAELDGEVWFKLDVATEAARRELNDDVRSADRVDEDLRAAAAACPTWLQTCVFALDGAPPADEELAAWLELVTGWQRDGVPLRGVLLYGVEREPRQPEAPRISKLDASWLEAHARRIEETTGLEVRVSA